MRHRLVLRAGRTACVVCLLFARTLGAQTIEAEWAAAADGDWTDATRWSGGVVPNANGADRFSGIIGVNAPADGSYEITINDDLDLVEIRMTAQRARVFHTGGRVTAEIITAAGDNYILQGGTIADATLNSERTALERGRFVVFGESPSTLENVTPNGAIYVGGTTSTTESVGPGTLRLSGGLQFQRAGRAIQFQGGGGEITATGDQTIDSTTGLSQISFGQQSDATARLASDGGTLTLGPNMLTRTLSSGQSFLGRDGTGLLNRGIIRADRGLEALTIEGNWSNEGRLEASDGGILNLHGNFTTAGMGNWSSRNDFDGGIAITGSLDNRGAVLDLTRDNATNIGGTLTLRGGQITGGVIRAGGSTSQFTSESMSGAAGTLDGVTVEGSVEITLGVTRLVNGMTLQNDASVNVRGATPLQTIIEVVGTQTIGGRGQLNFAEGSQAINVTAGSTLTLGEDITVRDNGGTFTIGSRGANLVNLGTVVATGSNQLAGDTVTNRGLISTSAGSIVSIDAATFINAGTITGNGEVNGNVTNESVIRPGDSPGTLMFDSLAQTSMGILEFEIGGLVPAAQHDEILVDNQFALSGTLDINLIDGFVPEIGNTFELMAWNSITIGDFAFDFADAGLTDGLRWNTDQFISSGQISVTAVPEPTTWLATACVMGATAWRRRRRV